MFGIRRRGSRPVIGNGVERFKLHSTRRVFTSKALPLIFGGGDKINLQERVSLAIAGHGRPHLPKSQIFGKNGVRSGVDALFFDEVLQVDYAHIPGCVNSEQRRFAFNKA
jgi:hypothetical protein